jgi:hypothetical protein
LFLGMIPIRHGIASTRELLAGPATQPAGLASSLTGVKKTGGSLVAHPPAPFLHHEDIRGDQDVVEPDHPAKPLRGPISPALEESARGFRGERELHAQLDDCDSGAVTGVLGRAPHRADERDEGDEPGAQPGNE